MANFNVEFFQSDHIFFNRISVLWDEEYQLAITKSGGDLSFASFAENHRFQIPEGCHWMR